MNALGASLILAKSRPDLKCIISYLAQDKEGVKSVENSEMRLSVGEKNVCLTCGF